MPVSVTMPDLGDSVTEATVSRWLRFPGDLIEEGEPLVEVSTDKVDTEINAPVSGRLDDILADEGDNVRVGANLAVIAQTASTAANPTTSEPGPAEPMPTTPTAESSTAPQAEAAHGTALSPGDCTVAYQNTSSAPPYLTPLVRRLATELGVNLAEIQGSGLGNRIRKSDVLAAANVPGDNASTSLQGSELPPAQQAVANPYLSPLIKLIIEQRGLGTSHLRGSGHNNRIRLRDLSPNLHQPLRAATRSDRTEKLTRLRSVIAARMVESLHTSAQLTTVVEVDVTAINALRQQHGPTFFAVHGVKPSFTAFFVRATVDALADFPVFNASVDTANGTATYHGGIHLNVAVDTDRGLLAPVIRDADTLSIGQIAVTIGDLAERARTNTLTVADLTGGTFTITNTGSRGALFDTPIINQPQVAILGTGAVVSRATVIRDDTGIESVDIRNMAYFALTYDHRLIDGADAARFLSALKARLETPTSLAEIV